MAKLVHIEADENAPEPVEVSEKTLLERVKAASDEVERIRMIRIGVRDEVPRSQVLKELAKTDEEFVAAIETLNAAERELGRFRRSDLNTQHVSVATVTEKGKAK